jgi:hypothetical protein
MNIIDDITRAFVANNDVRAEELIGTYLADMQFSDADCGAALADAFTLQADVLLPILEEYRELQAQMIEALQRFNIEARILTE